MADILTQELTQLLKAQKDTLLDMTLKLRYKNNPNIQEAIGSYSYLIDLLGKTDKAPLLIGMKVSNSYNSLTSVVAAVDGAMASHWHRQYSQVLSKHQLLLNEANHKGFN